MNLCKTKFISFDFDCVKRKKAVPVVLKMESFLSVGIIWYVFIAVNKNVRQSQDFAFIFR